MAERILIISPIPSHPLDQGNSARIHAIGRLLQSEGFLVHFLYCQLEGLTPPQQRQMEACWDQFHPVPTSGRSMAATGDGHYQIDDWYEPAVTQVARDLHSRWHFRAVLVNYVWFSRALDAFEPGVIKLLDTHDVFGGRHHRFVAAGLKPEWFYTTEQEESRGLARADIVLAIQEEEAAQFRALGHKDVRTIGHAIGRRQRVPRARQDGRVTIGYLASGNPLNTSSFERLVRALPPDGRPGLRFLVAGSICGKLTTPPLPFEAIGSVDHLDTFYDQVDVVVNPMTFGTGLKIKSVEAVFQGLPLIGTSAAMVGLPVQHSLHALQEPEDVATALRRLPFDQALLAELSAASRDCAAEYERSVAAEMRALIACIHQPGRIASRPAPRAR